MGQVQWDYCSKDNGHTRYGQVTWSPTFTYTGCSIRSAVTCVPRGRRTFTGVTWKLEAGTTALQRHLQVLKCLNRFSNIVCAFTGAKLRGGSGSHEGNVYLDGRPVCHDSWDDTDAAVVCRSGIMANLMFWFLPGKVHPSAINLICTLPRSLGFTGGQATRSSRFGRVPDNFVMDDVKCSGRELRLEDCRHNKRDNCGTREGAGVVCFTTTTTTTSATTTTTRPEERNLSSRTNKQPEPYSSTRVGWLTMAVVTGVCSVILLTLMTQKKCSSSSSRRKSTFKILLVSLFLLLILAGLGFGLALRPRKSNDVDWWVWMVVGVDGVLLAMSIGIFLEKKWNKRKVGRGEAQEETELPGLPA